MTHADPPPARRSPGLIAGLLAATAVVGVAVGYGAAVRGPLWLRPNAPSPPPIVQATSPDAALGARLADIETRLATLSAPAPAQDPVLSTEPGTQVLESRLREMQLRQDETLQAAAAALAVASLEQAAQRSGGFERPLAAARPLLPPSAAVDRLAAMAGQGAPSRVALASSFPDAARRAAAARPDTPGEETWTARIARLAASVVTIRRVGAAEGQGADAALARAERRIGDGDVDGALAEIRTLPPPARAAMAPWTARAQRRVEIDRALADVRAWALHRLAPPAAPDAPR